MMMSDEAQEQLERELKAIIATRASRRVFLGSLPFLLAACASTPQTRYREGDNTGQETTLTPQDEVQLTQEALPQLRKDYPPLNHPRSQQYIQQLGAEITRKNNLQGNPYNYNFTVVGTPAINAFALPAGVVFVTAPLIAASETEAELAGVVGHEVGHVVARHTAERMDQAKKSQNKSWLYTLGGGLLGGVLGYGLASAVCAKNDRDCLQRIATYGAAAGAFGGLLIQKYAFMANSREDEMEADRIGFRTSTRADYDKNHVGKFYEKLLVMEERNKSRGGGLLGAFADAMSTHPPSRERVAQMRQMVAETPKGAGKISSPTFEEIRKVCLDWTNRHQSAS